MAANIFPSDHPEEQISHLLSLIGQPTRIQILTIIGAHSSCVCHLEAVLGIRQSTLSQHLMALRKAGLVTAHREGRNVFYALADPEITRILEQVACLTPSGPDALGDLTRQPVSGCPCPHCNPDLDPALTCRSMPKPAKGVDPT